MKRTINKSIVTLGLLLLALMFSSASYAKLVVLSYTFPHDTQGFTATTTSNCGANFTINGSPTGLMVHSAAPAACAGTLELDKLVVLNRRIPRPSLEMTIVDSYGAVNTSSTMVTLNSQGSNFVWNINGNIKHGSANSAALNGLVPMRYLIHFSSGAQNFTVSSIIISSN